jgi:RecA/RadA recombinase
MTKLVDRKKQPRKPTIPSDEQIDKVLDQKVEPLDYTPFEGYTSKMTSTGSTLLDLNISGLRVRGGGIPSGILVEIYGPSSAGKTALLMSILGSVQRLGGKISVKDPEARLDNEYAQIYGTNIDPKIYSRPRTVEDLFDEIKEWMPKKPLDIPWACGTDSLAALSTRFELDPKKPGDKMGMARAKAFSANLRQVCGDLRTNNWLLVCTNQLRSGDSGQFVPGGNAVPFYASLRIYVHPNWSLKKENRFLRNKAKVFNDVEHEKITGIASTCEIIKNSVDEPFREADFYIVFGYGIDDIRANLIYNKKARGENGYLCPDGKEYSYIEPCISWIEQNNLEADLRERTIDTWEEVAKATKYQRKSRVYYEGE